MPGSLFDALKSIPVAMPPAGPVPGVMVDSASGRTVRTPENQTHGRGRRFRLGAGALVAGLAVGAVVVVSAGEHPAEPEVPFHQAQHDRCLQAGCGTAGAGVRRDGAQYQVTGTSPLARLRLVGSAIACW